MTLLSIVPYPGVLREIDANNRDIFFQILRTVTLHLSTFPWLDAADLAALHNVALLEPAGQVCE